MTMPIFELICYLIGLVLFIIATLNAPQRFNLVAAGLAVWILVPLVHAIRALGH